MEDNAAPMEQTVEINGCPIRYVEQSSDAAGAVREWGGLLRTGIP